MGGHPHSMTNQKVTFQKVTRSPNGVRERSGSHNHPKQPPRSARAAFKRYSSALESVRSLFERQVSQSGRTKTAIYNSRTASMSRSLQARSRNAPNTHMQSAVPP